MNVYRNRPKGAFMEESTSEELYALTQHWKSDLEFYRDDLRFLKSIFKKYTIWITKKENELAVLKIQTKIHQLDMNCKDLLIKIAKHLLDLTKLIEDAEYDVSRVFRMEHEHLEDAIAEFVKTFRESRKEVFRITEHIADSEQLKEIFK